GLCYPPLTWDASVKLPPQSASLGGRMGIDAVFGAARAQSSAGDFLHPDVAFRLEATAEGPDRVRLLWQIADGYYLYRSKTTVKTPSAEVQLGQLSMPQGKSKTDDYFGTQEVYYNELSAALPVSRAAGSSLELPLEVTYQGCADAGLCYPPITKTLSVTLPPGQGSGGGYVSSQDRFSSLIVSGNVLIMLA